MASLYMAQESSHGKAKGNIVSFPTEIELTAQNVATHCLGPHGMPHTTICFSDLTREDGKILRHYRQSDKFIQASCLYVDIDGKQHRDNCPVSVMGAGRRRAMRDVRGVESLTGFWPGLSPGLLG